MSAFIALLVGSLPDDAMDPKTILASLRETLIKAGNSAGEKGSAVECAMFWSLFDQVKMADDMLQDRKDMPLGAMPTDDEILESYPTVSDMVNDHLPGNYVPTDVQWEAIIFRVAETAFRMGKLS